MILNLCTSITYVYVISDLHLGGRGAGWSPENRHSERHPDRRMCSERGQELLVKFLKELSIKARMLSFSTVVLVINGDFVDFLAETNNEGKFSAFAQKPDDAVAKLDRIMNTPRSSNSANAETPERPGEVGCKEVFDELHDFLREPNAKIVLLLGNHDLELSWEKCKQILNKRLRGIESQVDETRADDGKLIIDTSGEQCIVGQLWIEHGNRYDIWNYVNYEQLHKTTNTSERAPFKQPLGSDLVIDVINPLKADHEFVDLLKPETRGVVPLLWYLLPRDRREGLASKIPLRWLLLKKFAQILGLHTPNWKAGVNQEADKAVTSNEGGPDSELEDANILFDETEFQELPLLRTLLSDELCNSSYRPKNRLEQHAQGETAFVDDVIAFFYWISPNNYNLFDYNNKTNKRKVIEEVHNIIKNLQTDPADRLATNSEKSEYLRAFRDIIEHRNTKNFNGKLERATDTVIFGHTHIMKHISEIVVSGDEPCHYINTGTWADLMLFPPQSLETTNTFIEDIQRKDLSKYKHNLPGFAFVRLESGKVAERALRVFCGTLDGSLEIKAEEGKALGQLADEYARTGSGAAFSKPAGHEEHSSEGS